MSEKLWPVHASPNVSSPVLAANAHSHNNHPLRAAFAHGLRATPAGLKLLIFSICSLWLMNSTLNATTSWPPAWPGTWLYCSPSGTGTGSDTNHPCSVSYGLSHTTAGNTLVFLDGDYNGEIDVGTSGITLGALHKWKARIVNPSGPNYSAGIAIYPNGTHNVTLDGFCVTNCLADGINSFGPSNTIKNCWVTHVGTAGYNGPSNGGGYGIYAKSQDYTVVDSCLVEHNGSVPSYDQGIYVGGKGVIVRNCVVRYNAAFGIQFNVFSGSCDQCQCYNNLCYSNATAGGNSFEFSAYSDSGTTGGTNYFYGNTILSRSSTVSYINYTVVCLTNNIIQGANYVAASGGIRSGHNLQNPASSNFVNPGKGLFWLTSGSAARGAAQSAICGLVDFFGNSQSSVSDEGFAQYSSTLASDTRTLDPTPANSDYWTSLTATNGGSVSSISVNPTSLNFGSIEIGLTAQQTLTVQNTGNVSISGTASTTSPFSIVSGASYSLAPGQSNVVTVLYSPTVAGTNSQTINFQGTSSATATATGVATSATPPLPPQNLHVVTVP